MKKEKKGSNECAKNRRKRQLLGSYHGCRGFDLTEPGRFPILQNEQSTVDLTHR